MRFKRKQNGLPVVLEKPQPGVVCIWTCFGKGRSTVECLPAFSCIFCKFDIFGEIHQMKYPETLSQLECSLLIAGFSNPLMIANIELKFRKSRQCLQEKSFTFRKVVQIHLPCNFDEFLNQLCPSLNTSLQTNLSGDPPHFPVELLLEFLQFW